MNSAGIESYVEAVRKAYYPDRPSRFASMFAAPSLAAAQTFGTSFPAPQGGVPPIYEVSAESFHRGDMTLLRVAPSILVQSFWAHLYWQGLTGPAGSLPPVWELVLPLPVKIGRRVAGAGASVREVSDVG